MSPGRAAVLWALVMAGQPERARRVAGEAADAGAPQSLAEEFAEALAQMRRDMQRSMPLLARILPGPLFSAFLGGTAPRRAALTTRLRVDLTATRGDDAADYPNKNLDEAECIERELVADGWTVHRKPAEVAPRRPRRRE